MKINDAFRADQKNAVLCWLATVSPEGVPNVSPKEIFALFDDESLVVADIMSPTTVRNIRANPKVCLSFVDVFRQKGFKVEGEALVVPREEAAFAVLGKDLLAMAGQDFPIKNVIHIRMTRISRILAPSYSLFPDRTEAERMQSAYTTYGVQPAG
ncbi:pyridoxamine 5'-phosphate oxidase family protein [Microvirga rosea]|uniref:pyridoxamine 5'-phosphate oxidase family protein n=1 Tax=Microvirga rosea TaxID=2715425 RepID=UPI001D09F04B|nr:pyridoxamine 5'-phosphate oxidase family protein [Microvirga rosea]MCB8820249.1 pyridoxamine 5'-phosphate oxidase family protein [Microvirga rosea]